MSEPRVEHLPLSALGSLGGFIGEQMIEEQQAEIERLRAEIEVLKDLRVETYRLLAGGLSAPCRYDHNRLCQEHFLDGWPCPAARLRELTQWDEAPQHEMPDSQPSEAE